MTLMMDSGVWRLELRYQVVDTHLGSGGLDMNVKEGTVSKTTPRFLAYMEGWRYHLLLFTKIGHRKRGQVGEGFMNSSSVFILY